MAGGYKAPTQIYPMKGEVRIIDHDGGAMDVADFAAIDPMLTIHSDGITLNFEPTDTTFPEVNGADVKLTGKMEVSGTIKVGERSPEMHAILLGQDPTADIYQLTADGIDRVNFWKSGEAHKFAMAIQGTDPNGKPVGYILHNVVFSPQSIAALASEEGWPELAFTGRMLSDTVGPGLFYRDTN